MGSLRPRESRDSEKSSHWMAELSMTLYREGIQADAYRDVSIRNFVRPGGQAASGEAVSRHRRECATSRYREGRAPLWPRLPGTCGSLGPQAATIREQL